MDKFIRSLTKDDLMDRQIKHTEKDLKGRPSHLGGGERRCHTDEGSLKYMSDNYHVESMLDIGAGRGGQMTMAEKLGIATVGVDGDTWGAGKYWEDHFIIVHDYQESACPELFGLSFDLVWCVEFLEHVEEQYMDNYMDDISRGQYVICTHATPDMQGHHHVNLQEKEYWIEAFKSWDFTYDPALTEKIKEHSSMVKYFIKKNGLVFINDQL